MGKRIPMRTTRLWLRRNAKCLRYAPVKIENLGNPYSWEFDFCSLTLGNFNYRKMTLMRDYENLVEGDLGSEAFDSIFSLEPKPSDSNANYRLPINDHHLVIPCDATQASAIARARTGQSYIIQGPPGTGKSQTITNLIADFVARGKRVLFVCEKRAAIDVVFHRLRQKGLDELCCLIHDSQSDKKAFIQNLRQTSEQWLAGNNTADQEERGRASALKKIEQELTALGEFSMAMTGSPEILGLPLREILERLIVLKKHLKDLSPEQEEQLPYYRDWLTHGNTIERLDATLGELGEDRSFVSHPFRWLNLGIVQKEEPLHTFLQKLEKTEGLLEEVSEGFLSSGLPENRWDTLAEIEAICSFVMEIKPLADKNLLNLLDSRSPAAKRLEEAAANQLKQIKAHSKAVEKNCNWKVKLPAMEAEAALEQAKKLRGNMFPYF